MILLSLSAILSNQPFSNPVISKRFGKFYTRYFFTSCPILLCPSYQNFKEIDQHGKIMTEYHCSKLCKFIILSS